MSTVQEKSGQGAAVPDNVNSDAERQYNEWLSVQASQQRSPVGVVFRDVKCIGRRTTDTCIKTVTSSLTSSLISLTSAFGKSHSEDHVEVISGFHGLVKPSEMLLVLGRPGSGCSTFLKAITGQLHGFQLGRESSINYQGTQYDDFHKHHSSKTRYLAELDVHFPDLAVRQTLEFAAQLSSNSSNSVNSLETVDATHVAQDIASQFGLNDAYETMIGNVLIRGVSGGEKRRTSIAEAFINASPFQCWDNSTRGLDSLTAKRFIELLRKTATRLDLTVAMSLYQTSELMYRLFDKVVVLYEGREIYFGPIDKAADYFYDLGFARPSNATTPDFLTSLTNSEERVRREDWDKTLPDTADEFEAAWINSDQGKRLREEMAAYEATFTESINALPLSSESDKLVSVGSQVKACLERARNRFLNNPAPTISNIVANSVLGVIIGSAFFNLAQNSDSLQTRSILLFFIAMLNSFLPAFEVDIMWEQRPIVEKQHRYHFYYPFIHHLAVVLFDFPAKILLTIFLHLPVYFMTNLRRDAAAFFTYWVFMIVNIVTMSMLFRMIGAISRSRNATMIPVPVLTLLCVVYTGFVVPPPHMVPWLGWFRFINPIAYTYESLMVNEMHGRRFPCSTSIPDGSEYSAIPDSDKLCSQVGRLQGTTQVSGSEFLHIKYGYMHGHMWRNLGILVAMLIILGFLHFVASEYILAEKSRGEVLQYKPKSRSALSDEETPASSSTKRSRGVGSEKKGETQRRPQPLMNHQSQPDTTVDVQPAVSASKIFHWYDISYDVKIKGGTRKILQDINGWVKPGTLTALMGSTGAGKTTLLDALAGRAMPGKLSGTVKIDGSLRDASPGWQRRIGYVQQNDIHLPTATVREALQFSALLRQSSSNSKREKLAYVDTILETLEMESYADAMVGMPGEGLNVEQRKRLSIGVEMAARPDLVLFLDEPTSGLDSQTAWSICMLLRKLVDRGHAILCTVHQPSAQLFALFDKVLLLKDGQTAYFGETGAQASTLKGFLQSRGARACSPDENPAEWMIEAIEHAPNNSDNATENSSWGQIWKESNECSHVKLQLSQVPATINSSTDDDASELNAIQSTYGASLFQQLSILTQRVLRDQWRTPIYLYTKFAASFGLSLMNGISFYKVDHNIQGIISLLFSIFLICQLFSLLSMLIIPRFVSGRDLFEARERDSRMYSWTIFLSANMLVEIVWLTLVAVFVFVPWYYPTGMYDNGNASFGTAERGGLAFLLVLLFIVWASTISQVFAAFMDESETAIQMVTLCFWLSLLFCGILVTKSELPRFWIFMYRVSPLTYFLEGLAIAGVAGAQIQCSRAEVLKVALPKGMQDCQTYLKTYLHNAGGYLLDSKDDAGFCSLCPISQVDSVLESLGMATHRAVSWRNVGILFGYIAFDVLLVFALYYLLRLPRNKR